MSRKPNILFVFSDQQRWDTMGCYGQKMDVTPNLDKLASEGVRFVNAFTCQPVCGPARACIQTGRFATEVNVYRNAIRLPENMPLLADRMNEAGYQTAYVGKWHLATNREQLDPAHRPEENYEHCAVPPERRGGYRDWWIAADTLEWTSDSRGGRMWDIDGNARDFQGYRVDWTTDCALDFLRARKTDNPFFMFLSYLEPHHQNARHRYEGPEGSWEMFKDHEVPPDLQGTGGDWRQNYPEYLGCCHAIDRNFARLRAELEQQGEWDNTLVIYCADHGSHFRTRNAEYKRTCHDASIHIPMIVRGPGFAGGKVVSDLVSLLDSTATVLRAGDAEALPEMRGSALQDVIDGAPEDWRREVFVQISESGVGRAIRTDRWTYSVTVPNQWMPMQSEEYTEDYLYDNENDPGQRNNLIRDPEYADLRAKLAERLRERIVQAGEPEPRIMPAL